MAANGDTAPARGMLATGALEFSAEQRQIIRDTYANGANDLEFAVLMEIAKARRLNPLLKQIYFVSRWDDQKKRHVWTPQTGIDGLRAIAERTGLYAGQDEPEWFEDEDGKLQGCKVRVYRKDWARPAVGVAYWSEYVQVTGGGQPTKFWRTMPRTMIAKVAEALALRKAFPEDTGGLYTADEMDQADNAPEAIEATATDVHQLPSGQRAPSPLTNVVPADRLATARRTMERAEGGGAESAGARAAATSGDATAAGLAERLAKATDWKTWDDLMATAKAADLANDPDVQLAAKNARVGLLTDVARGHYDNATEHAGDRAKLDALLEAAKGDEAEGRINKRDLGFLRGYLTHLTRALPVSEVG